MNTPNFTQDWFTLGENALRTYLEPLKGQDNLVFMEIGSFEGRSAIWFLENLLTGKNCGIICVDTFQGSNEFNQQRVSVDGLEDRFLENMKPYQDRYQLIKGSSQYVLKAHDYDDKLDLIYIDGSHEASDVLEDLCLSYRAIKKGGYLVMDDYMWNHSTLPSHKSPKIAIDGFMECFKVKIAK
jgi:predicted O-methyltransferase YrrM